MFYLCFWLTCKCRRRRKAIFSYFNFSVFFFPSSHFYPTHAVFLFTPSSPHFFVISSLRFTFSPLLPGSPIFPSYPFFFSYQIQLVLPVCFQMRGFPLECGQLLRGYILKEDQLFFSQQLPLAKAPWLGSVVILALRVPFTSNITNTSPIQICSIFFPCEPKHSYNLQTK